MVNTPAYIDYYTVKLHCESAKFCPINPTIACLPDCAWWNENYKKCSKLVTDEERYYVAPTPGDR